MQQHQARKRFGQNFLHDEGVIHQIVRAIDPQPQDKLIEIGPGMSALTLPLIQAVQHLQVIEIDRDLVQYLQKRYSAEQLSILSADVLTVDFSQFGPGLRIVGNLPYNISSPLLFHLMQFADQVIDQHFMLQKEVIERMVAKPGDSLYGRLSIMLQARYRMQKLFDVAPEAFDPAPKVTSAVVRMRPLKADRPQAKNAAVFEKVVAQAFSQRRKMLRRTLAQWAQHIDWEQVGIDPTDRAEHVSLQQYIALSDALTPVLAL
ncbi:16S rRNA (adenine1518-N6/adenine1519-N6)-dimethyltransferase [Paenalcaligenes hominis]|uniref:Ribosomal RNA small subunit methyltransferase A n=1 Tax=Paenalcaligenes hominis TaxID=643674 RepID=A0ABX0WN64_9BURK|nr:16S rRNA (adenine(1518)-N(6)/adenine(1519)-N(6))-dimethyltransferase RsmA [Paenalcaligenes hominis]NJB64708.1 16S rRNA (adenine1518-N6/adenine1519-N6)-dimethyltransferase [Paenalcaligenes hominis]GGE59696.1 ribosomal RNA small subunit methyltransferase A [Paenalcaligenes hominis]